MADKLQQIGRLAMRVEGDWWVAYYAMPNTMDNAIRLGTVAMRIVANRDRKEEFLAFMQAAVTDLLQGVTGAKAEWPDGPQPAPESERSGHA